MKKKFYIVLLLVLTAGCIKAQEAKYIWNVRGSMKYPVSGAQVVYDIAASSDKIYLLGGYSDSLQSEVDWIQEYDVVKNSWRIVGRMLQPREQFVADIWKNSIMYFGGAVGSSTDKNSIETWDYKIVTNLPSVYDRAKNFGRSFSTGQIVGNTLYIIGGNPSTQSDTLDYIVGYNLDTKQVGFTFKSPSANTFSQRMTFIVSPYIYIFGGVLNGVTNTIQRFNISQQKLENLTEKLLDVRAAGSAVYNPLSQKGFIIGGYNEKFGALNTVEEIEFLPDGTLSIKPGPPLTYARTNLMAVAYKNGLVAVFGGRTDRGHSGSTVPYFEILELVTSVEAEKENLPLTHKLWQNYPNPFNPSTNIAFDIAAEANLSLDIYNTIGEHIITLLNSYKVPGSYIKTWNGTDKFGKMVPSGVYFVTLKINSNSFKDRSTSILTQKMLLIK
ncbi:MAG: T9SS type A sorting domain-containing protein [Bacteroidota bacterium]